MSDHAEELRQLPQTYHAAFPVDQLREHPANARQGVEHLLDQLMDDNGFHGALLVQAGTGIVLSGNHRLKVARRKGATTLPVIEVEADDQLAKRILLGDNRASDQATYDDQALAELLAGLAADDPVAGLAGTGFDSTDLDRLLAELAPPDFLPEDGTEQPRLDETAPRACPFCHAQWRVVAGGEVQRVEPGESS